MENNTLCNRHSLGVNNHTKMYVTYTRIYGWSDYGGESSYQPGYRLENMMWMTLLVYDYIIPGEKSIYMVAKSIAVFITAGVSAVFPLLLNLMLTMTVLPVITYDWYQLPNYKAVFMKLAIKNVVVYSLVYMILIFVFAGLIAGLALSLSLYANNRFVVMSLPFLICVVSGRLVTYASNPIIRGLAIQKVFYVPQSSPTTLVSLCILFVVLVICGYVHFIVRGVKMDVL